MTYKEVGKNVGWNKKRIKCLVVRNLTKELIDSDILQCLYKNRYTRYSWNKKNEDGWSFVDDVVAGRG